MAAALLCTDARGGFVPLVEPPLLLGADPTCVVCDESEGVAPVHATLTVEGGAYRVEAGPGLHVEVDGTRTERAGLVAGSVLRLVPHGRTWHVRLESADPPSLPVSAPHRVHRLAWGGSDCAFRHLPPLRTEDGDLLYLRLLGALGGSAHAALAPVVDGGLTEIEGKPRRWLATHWVEGVSGRDLLLEGEVAPRRVLPLLRSLSGGLARLHARGVIHRDVAPGNVIVTPDGSGVLIDYGQAVLADEPLPPSAAIVGTPGFVAPEEVVYGPGAVTTAVDVYGLAAVGYTLITGSAPSCGDDVLDALARTTITPPHPSAYGIDLPAAFEEVLLAALGPDPQDRPDAAAFAQAVAGAEREGVEQS